MSTGFGDGPSQRLPYSPWAMCGQHQCRRQRCVCYPPCRMPAVRGIPAASPARCGAGDAKCVLGRRAVLRRAPHAAVAGPTCHASHLFQMCGEVSKPRCVFRGPLVWPAAGAGGALSSESRPIRWRRLRGSSKAGLARGDPPVPPQLNPAGIVPRLTAFENPAASPVSDTADPPVQKRTRYKSSHPFP